MKVPFICTENNKFLSMEVLPHSQRIYIERGVYFLNGLIISEKELSTPIHQHLYDFFMEYNISKYKPLTNIPYKLVPGTTLILSHLTDDNYSHFTRQLLPNFLLAKHMGILNAKSQILMPSTRKFHKNMEQFYNMSDYILSYYSYNVLYQFECAIYCDTLFDQVISDPWIMQLFEKANPSKPEPPSINLYITRRSNKRRAVINESEIEELLKKEDFITADFDVIPVEEQARLIQKAKIIIAAHGASGANLVYKSGYPFKFIEWFSPNRISNCHANILFFKNCDYTPVLADALTGDKPAKPEDPYYLNPDLISEALEKTSYTFIPFQRNTHENELISLDHQIRSHMPPAKVKMAPFQTNGGQPITDADLGYLLYVKERRFDDKMFAPCREAPLTGYACGFINFLGEYFAGLGLYLSNLASSTVLSLNIYDQILNLPRINFKNLIPVYSREYQSSDLDLQYKTQEVRLITRGCNLEPNRMYIFALSSNNWLGCGSAKSDLPVDMYYFRGYVSRNHSPTYTTLHYNNTLYYRMLNSKELI